MEVVPLTNVHIFVARMVFMGTSNICGGKPITTAILFRGVNTLELLHAMNPVISMDYIKKHIYCIVIHVLLLDILQCGHYNK